MAQTRTQHQFQFRMRRYVCTKNESKKQFAHLYIWRMENFGVYTASLLLISFEQALAMIMFYKRLHFVIVYLEYTHSCCQYLHVCHQINFCSMRAENNTKYMFKQSQFIEVNQRQTLLCVNMYFYFQLKPLYAFLNLSLSLFKVNEQQIPTNLIT